MNWIVWILFQIMVGHHHFQSLCGYWTAKIWPTWPKSKSILNIHPISVHTNFELDCVNTFSNNFIRKQTFPQSSHTTRSQQTRYHTFQTVPPLGSPLLRLSYSTCPGAWTISHTAFWLSTWWGPLWRSETAFTSTSNIIAWPMVTNDSV